MEQRLLRLGDIVDDYCPRERRITNHAIVAVVDDAIRQTRCTTCDAEHVYKHAKEPRRRKKGDTSTLFEEVLADVAGPQRMTPRIEPTPAVVAASAATPAVPPVALGASQADQSLETAPVDRESETQAATETPAHVDGWLAHRQLIRATLPRVEGEQPPPRPIPEFTMHQRPMSRGHGHRYAQGRDGHAGHGRGRGGPSHTNGNSFGNGHPHGNGHGNGGGNGSGNGQGRPGKRHRSRNRRGR